MSTKIISKTISNIEYEFIVSSALADAGKAVHVNVKIDRESRKTFSRNVENKSQVFKTIATQVAKDYNNKAFLRINPINTLEEWQGQFDF